MNWLVTTLFIVFAFGHLLLLEAKHLKNNPPSSYVVIVGKVYCDTCFQQNFGKTSHFISGATVAVECKRGAETFYAAAKTDRRGVFKVHLPFSLTKHVKTIRGCSVKLIKSSEPYCAVASTAMASSSSIRLESRSHGTHVFSAGFFTFKPQNQPSLCNQKPITLDNNNNNNPEVSFPPALKDPTNPGDLPPLPSLPIPNIPLPDLSNLPTLPNFPSVLPILPHIPPIIAKTEKMAARVHPQTFNIFPPNTFLQPQPSTLPNLPQIPSLLPPLSPLLPRLPSINLPPIITTTQKTAAIRRDHARSAAVHPQTFNIFPPSAFPQPQPFTHPNLPQIPSLLPPFPPLLPRLPSINLPPIITATKRTATIKRGLNLDHKHDDHPRVDTKETLSLPPNPFLPPPLVPNPLQPTPPPLFPFPFQPPAAANPFFPIPTVPNLIMSPPPPPPVLPLLPPFPLHPPRGPGTPPTV